ncbi:hypothetical protein B0T21DRAFT_345148 [Apiosordaria backusii]|uniref:Uncharacterized protein n=1 Tax=Apiosordaria backusii TaxID=314023 RepID=A0AA40K3X7_9PEZI|nr:hypothetical protein B0T21DRAFT_345148 [Apiosordaria backusii]
MIKTRTLVSGSVPRGPTGHASIIGRRHPEGPCVSPCPADGTEGASRSGRSMPHMAVDSHCQRAKGYPKRQCWVIDMYQAACGAKRENFLMILGCVAESGTRVAAGDNELLGPKSGCRIKPWLFTPHTQAPAAFGVCLPKEAWALGSHSSNTDLEGCLKAAERRPFVARGTCVTPKFRSHGRA